MCAATLRDKRPYIDVKHVREPAKWKPALPPTDVAGKGYRLQDGKAVDPALNEILTVGLCTSSIQLTHRA